MLWAVGFFFLFFPTTQSVKALSPLCEASRMANQPIYLEDFVLKFTLPRYRESVRRATSVIMTPMIGANVPRAWFALASRSALIWSAKRQRWGRGSGGWYYDSWQNRLSSVCRVRHFLYWRGKEWHQRSPRRHRSVTMTTEMVLSGGVKSAS